MKDRKSFNTVRMKIKAPEVNKHGIMPDKEKKVNDRLMKRKVRNKKGRCSHRPFLRKINPRNHHPHRHFHQDRREWHLNVLQVSHAKDHQRLR